MKFISLISSGIDSPVATYMLSTKVEETILLHADNRPFTDDREIEKFFTLAKYLKTLIPSKLIVWLIPHGQMLQIYKTRCDNKFTCVVCKRMMLRYTEAIAKNEHANAIIMGDSLGQVASQTLQNIRVIEEAISIPILRPLIGFDKEDTIKIAKKIGTFNLSIAPAEECKAVPNKPSTQARIEQIHIEEQKLNIDELVRFAVMHTTKIIL
jgi:thiamine biosynthesis protein ThiI